MRAPRVIQAISGRGLGAWGLLTPATCLGFVRVASSKGAGLLCSGSTQVAPGDEVLVLEPQNPQQGRAEGVLGPQGLGGHTLEPSAL